MSSLFEDLKNGLQEAIDYEKGIGTAKTYTLVIDPVKKYSNTQIKAIRNRTSTDRFGWKRSFDPNTTSWKSIHDHSD